MRTPQPPILVSVADAAEMLGISRASLYRLINGKQIPSLILPGTRSRRIPVAGLKQWVERSLECRTDILETSSLLPASSDALNTRGPIQ